jgi:hypothetical protein
MEEMIFQEPKYGEKIFQKGYDFLLNFNLCFCIGIVVVVLTKHRIQYPEVILDWWFPLIMTIGLSIRYLLTILIDGRRITITYFEDYLLFNYLQGFCFPLGSILPFTGITTEVTKVYYWEIDYILYYGNDVVFIKLNSPDSKTLKVKCSKKRTKTCAQLVDFINNKYSVQTVEPYFNSGFDKIADINFDH